MGLVLVSGHVFENPVLNAQEMNESPQDIELKHGARLSALIASMAEGKHEATLSEFAFANLWLFRREHRYQLVDGDWPVISGYTYDGLHHAMPLFKPDKAPLVVIDGLLDRHDCLYPMAASAAAALTTHGFATSANRDDSDYVYPAAHFQHYRGRRLNKKQNLMNQLRRSHQVEAEPYGADWESHALKVLAGWMHDKKKPADSADERPCRDALAHASALGLWGFGYRVDGIPAGFLLAEQLAPGVHAVRFAKSRNAFNGLAQYMFHHASTHGPAGLAWFNFEQDLGLPNFRHTKLSYQPSALLDKFRVRRRS